MHQDSWRLLVCLLLPCLISSFGRASETQPNIVLIMADDLGWKDLHCYGNKKLDTPNLDRLAEQGLLFTDAYSAAPVCTPTRAALMTGESPARLNITNHAGGHPPNFQKAGTDLITPTWLRHLPLERVTLAEQLKKAGYATGFVGKWHLSHRPRAKTEAERRLPTEPELRPEHQGFDINVGGCRFGGPPSYFSPYKIPNLEGKFDGEYLPDRCADECIRFIDSAQSESKQPFFLCWWNYSVHYPFQAPEDLIAKYDARKGPGVENPTYAAMIEGMDRSIGKVIQAINERGLSNDTLIIFTSDNGPFAANVKPLRAEKGHLYEGGIRVPMIIRWPGHVRAAETTATPVITMDIHATVLEVTGLESDPSNVPDGVSLVPLFGRQTDLGRESLYFHYPNYAFHKQNRLGSAIRSGDYKLIKYYDDNSVELYDLKNDIGESQNIASERAELSDKMLSELETWLLDTRASRPQRVNTVGPEDDPNRPNVLLIGDSISIGYTPHVREQLSGQADVFRIRGNGKHSSYGLKNLEKWITTRRWDVIHFNWGLWDLCYRNPASKTQGNRDKINGTLTTTPDQYRANLEAIVSRLIQTKAQLIWCATTPVPEEEAGRKLGDDLEYNRIAKEVMDANGIAINDLHSYALLKLPEIQIRQGDVHFTQPGYVHLAEQVAREIASGLERQSADVKAKPIGMPGR
ncbi:MAG: sulfatase-like hydrolase/transferase [Planctomycetota bacterium]